MIHHERLTATIDGDFVVFLIGMRPNQPWEGCETACNSLRPTPVVADGIVRWAST